MDTTGQQKQNVLDELLGKKVCVVFLERGRTESIIGFLKNFDSTYLCIETISKHKPLIFSHSAVLKVKQFEGDAYE